MHALRRRDLLALGAAVASTRAALSQAMRVPRVAWLANSVLAAPEFVKAVPGARGIVAGLAELGYVEGKTISIEYFLAPAIEDLPSFAARAVATQPDLIVAAVTPGALAAKNATATIPVVFYNSSVPVEAGIVASLARPGGNVTGVTNVNNQLAGKSLELLREIRPNLSRAALLYQPEDPSGAVTLAEILKSAPLLGIEALAIEAPQPSDFTRLFSDAVSKGAQAAQVIDTAYFVQIGRQIVDAAETLRLPTIYSAPSFADAGGLITYGANTLETGRRAATFVDRILKGAKPADLPVEQPQVFDLVVNLTAAKAIGVAVPGTVLVRATRLIE